MLEEKAKLTSFHEDFSVLNVGCGFIKGLHQRKGDVGLDIRRGICDIVGDAQNLPFREGVFDRILLYAVLEHLEDPIKCLKESRRVIKDGGRFEIVIPIEARGYYTDFKRLFTGFPFSVVELYKKGWRKLKYKPIPHLNRIQPKHIAKLLKIEKVSVSGAHSWFLGRKGKILRKLFRNLPSSFEGRDWHIDAIKDKPT